MNTQDTYKFMTDVNINEAVGKNDPRSIGYVGEYAVLKTLLNIGYSPVKIMLNVEIPVQLNAEKKTEIDLLMIHPAGIFVFEIKNHKGTIYGKDTDSTWTEFFKVSNNERLNNPIKQNLYHVSALKNMFPDMPIYPVVVFANQECKLKIQNMSSMPVVRINGLKDCIDGILAKSSKKFTIEEIENCFKKLVPYSRINNKKIPTTPNMDFSAFIEELMNDRINSRMAGSKAVQQYNRRKIWLTGITAFVVLICVLTSVLRIGKSKKAIKADADAQISLIQADANAKIENAQMELETFKSQFHSVTETKQNKKFDIDLLVGVSDVSIKSSTAITDTSLLSFNLTALSDEYGIVITEESKILVTVKNGEVYEYSFWTERNAYSKTSLYNLIKSGNIWCHEQAVTGFELFGVVPEDIVYIKINHVDVDNPDNYYLNINNMNPFEKDLEIEIFNAK